MATYHVYVHERLPDEAIRDGFSWPGFVLGWFWALRKRLYKVGVSCLVAEIVLVGGFFLAQAAHATLWALGALLAAVLVRAFIGLRGTYWRENSMGWRGFQFAESVQAEDPELAIARALRVSRTSTTTIHAAAGGTDGSSGAGVSGTARTSGVGGAEKAATISEMDFEKLGLAPASQARSGESQLDAGNGTAGRAIGGMGRAAGRKPGKKVLAFAAAALVLVIAGGLVIWSQVGRHEVATPPFDEAADDEGATVATAAEASATVVDAQSQPGAAAAPAPPAGTGPLPVTGAPAAAGSQAAANATQGKPAPPAGPPAIRDRSPAAKAAAWDRYYRQPSNCVNPKDWDAYVECVNQRIRARDAFEQKWRSGELR
jgi:hypothetical protein